MDIPAILARSAEQERDRIRFLEHHRSVQAAHDFARQTLSIYRRAVLNRAAPACEPAFRLRFIGSYCYLKRYLGPTGR